MSVKYYLRIGLPAVRLEKPMTIFKTKKTIA